VRIHLRRGRELFFAIEFQAFGGLNARVSVLNCFAGVGMVSNKDDLLLRDFFCGRGSSLKWSAGRRKGAGVGDREPARKLDATQGI
jgi:hypothetical protein